MGRRMLAFIAILVPIFNFASMREKRRFSLPIRGNLINAVVNRSDGLVAEYLSTGALVNEQDGHGWTALHHAAFHLLDENSIIVRLLLAKGADPNAMNNGRDTPLHIAVMSNNFSLMKRLITPENINLVDLFGWTPLDVANNTNHHEIVSWLKMHGGKTAQELLSTSMDSVSRRVQLLAPLVRRSSSLRLENIYKKEGESSE